MKLTYLELDGQAFVFDPKTLRIFHMVGHERIEVADPAVRARIKLHATTIEAEPAEKLAGSADRALWAGL